jgi:hypothetical protein
MLVKSAQMKDSLLLQTQPHYTDSVTDSRSREVLTVYLDGSRSFDDLISVIGICHR